MQTATRIVEANEAPNTADVQVFYRGVSFKLAPTPEQALQLARFCGVRRWIHNWAHAHIVENSRLWQEQRDAGVPPEDRVKPWRAWDLTKKLKDERPEWWSEVSPSSWIELYAVPDAVDAHRKFLRGEARFPRFARKATDRDRFSVVGRAVKADHAGSVYLPKIGWVPTCGAPSSHAELRRKLRRGRARLMRVTISRRSDGSWWFSAQVEYTAKQPPQHPRDRDTIVGVDRGIRLVAIAATTDGDEVSRLHGVKQVRRAERKAARADRRLSRRRKAGVPLEEQSSGYWKARAARGRAHDRARRLRNERLHIYSRDLVEQSPVIVLEDLNVRGMMNRRGRLGKAFSNSALGDLGRQISYKAEDVGATVLHADRWFPSSKRCSGCGWVKPKLDRSASVYRCEQCGLRIDRDLNAATNLAAWGEVALQHPELTPTEITALLLSQSCGGVTHARDPRPAGRSAAQRHAGGGESSLDDTVVPSGQPAVEAGTTSTVDVPDRDTLHERLAAAG